MASSRDPHAPGAFRLLTLGGLSLVDGSGTAVGQQRRRLALLALLSSDRDQGLSRDRLMALLSPESATDSARHSLQQLIYYVRQTVGDDAFLGTDPLRLNPAVITCDGVEFEDAIDRGDLARAAALYRGPFLDGFHLNLVGFEEWVAAERSRKATRYSAALGRLARASESAGDRSAAVEWWRQLAAVDPLSGSVALSLMRALAATGDASGALRHARVHEELVRSELGGPPDPEVGAFAARLAAGAQPARPAAKTFVGDTDSATTNAAPDSPRASHRRRFRAVATISAVLLVALAGELWRRSHAEIVSPGRVAVFPFRVSTQDTTLNWLGAGMVDLLTIRLAGEGRMRLAEPGGTLQALRRENRYAELQPETVRRVAAVVQANRVVLGSVTGSSRHVVLSASIRAMPDADGAAHASVEGPPDSLPVLIDQLAAQLLGISAGVDRTHLASLTSASLPAIRAYLEGTEALRAGRLETAIPRFRTAIELDSTFALAGLGLARAALKVGLVDLFARGRAVATARQDRLSESDRALLSLTTIDWDGAPAMYARWNDAVLRFPEVPEMWYGLGDAYYRWGTLAGVDRFLERAEDAFRKGWVLDSAAAGAVALSPPSPFVAEPLRIMVELAQMRGDVARVRQLVSIGLAADSTSDLAQVLRWHRAVANREPRDAFWKGLGGTGYWSVGPIFMFTTWTGVPAEDYPIARAEALRRTRFDQPAILRGVLRSTALNEGRPSDAESTTEGATPSSKPAMRLRVHDALSWGGSTASAIAAVAELADVNNAPPSDARSADDYYRDVCTVGRWRAAQNDMAAVQAATTRLRARPMSVSAVSVQARSEHGSQLCAALLDAIRLSALRLPGALEQVRIADSLATTWIIAVGYLEVVSDANLVLSKLWEEHGDRPRALRAARRRGGRFMDYPAYLSTSLFAEGRLAALTGDTAGATRAYRHYLALRFRPEPSARPEVDRVRRELALTARLRQR